MRCRAITRSPRPCAPTSTPPASPEDRKGWLFRTARGHKADALSDRAMNQSDAWCMIRRRAKAAGIAAEIGCHTFRATGIAAYLANGGAESRAKGIAHAKAAIEQLLHGVYKQA